MTDEKQTEIIIVRRRPSDGEEGHHGGAWKIAYADFVTAMMAFFLVLWILNSTNKETHTMVARYFNPVKMEDFAKAKRGIREAQQKAEKPGTDEGEKGKQTPPGEGKATPQQKDPDQKARSDPMSEESLFQNPYAALEQIAGKVEPTQDSEAGARAGAAESGALEAFRDPFKSTGGDQQGDAGDSPKTPPSGADPLLNGHDSAPPPTSASDEKAADVAPPSVPTKEEASQKAAAAQAQLEAARLQGDIGQAIKSAVKNAEAAPRLEVKSTREGLLISLTDGLNFGMFESGSSEPNPKLVHIMDKIAQTLKAQPGGVVVRGYTDSRRYRSGVSDNWRLSASRAQMALYMLVRGGFAEARVESVEGFADRRPKVADRPEAAENRRIEILLRKAGP